jgi:hypothetical protein
MVSDSDDLLIEMISAQLAEVYETQLTHIAHLHAMNLRIMHVL